MNHALANTELERRIHLVRSHRVMLTADLAELYEIEPRALAQAVKRNRDRFPDDFCFQLTPDEVENLTSRTVISSWGGSRRATYAFTEHGVVMLSSVLRGQRAIEVNIAVVRAFVRLRAMLATNRELARKVKEMEQRYDAQFRVVFEAIEQLMEDPEPPARRRIGFGQAKA